jgi:hypothetical protein
MIPVVSGGSLGLLTTDQMEAVSDVTAAADSSARLPPDVTGR